jgi:predicted RNase H-like HicB family nuclease
MKTTMPTRKPTTRAIRSEARRLAVRPYKFTAELGEDGVWTSGVLEIPGVISEGDSPGEAIENAREALVGIIALHLEEGSPIPEPFETREYSGQMYLRLSPDIHRRAVLLAAERNMSLNRWLATAVARETGLAELSH